MAQITSKIADVIQKDSVSAPKISEETRLIDGLSAEDISHLSGTDAIANDTRSRLPDTASFQAFLEDFPYFRAFGFIDLGGANPTVDICGVSYSVDDVQGTPKPQNLDGETRRLLRRRILEVFIDADTIELTPDRIYVEYNRRAACLTAGVQSFTQ